MSSTEKHIIRTSHRICHMVVTETSSSVVLTLSCSKYGELGDEDHIMNWFDEIIEPYKDDKRQMLMRNPETKECYLFDSTSWL